MQGSAGRIWIVVGCVGLFFLGYGIREFLAEKPETAAPSYLEKLTRELELTDDQQHKIGLLLDEEDQLVNEVLKGDLGQSIRDRIQEIRKKISGKIVELLNTEQQQSFSGSQPAKGFPEGIK